VFAGYVLIQKSQPTKEDAEAITIPHICLAAPSDNKDGGIDAYKEAFSQKGKIGEVETYPTMFHGWMGGRAKFEDEENAKEFERG
jgi:dienelactone hydrolase